MIGFRSLCAFLAAACLLPPPSASETERRFRMYRNPPKPRLVVLPAGGRLEPPVRELFDQALAKETRKLEDFRVADLPQGVALDDLGQLPKESLRVLRDKHGVDLVLQSAVEEADGRFILSAEIIDTRKGSVRADSREECRCPASELMASLLPRSLARLTGSPRLRGMRCGDGMALIPSLAAPDTAAPDSARGALGPGAFCMDLYEFPNKPSGEPVVEKTWAQAEALCAKEGKRLCTEPEWELACGGWKALEFPYGGSYQADRCNTRSVTIQLSGGNAGCRSPFGAYDLSGNVYEWTSTKWGPKYRDKVVKGGNWNAGAENSSCKARFGQPPGSVSKAIGFRCCLTLDR